MLLISKNSTPSYVKDYAGGKAYHLYLLSKEGFNVPEWLAIPPEALEDFLKINNITSEFYNSQDKECEILLEKTPWPNQLKQNILKARKELNSPLISVRSSAIGEDSATQSYAGQLSSFLYIESDEALLSAVKKCWASSRSARVLSYQKHNQLESRLQMSVILQTMIDPEISGVMFTCDPIKGDPNSIIINSVYGVGEGLVSGALDADTFTVVSDKITQKNIVKKEQRFSRNAHEETTSEEIVEIHLQDIQSLSDEQILTLSKLGQKIEEFYHRPQDIEWAYKDGQFTILQSRPVTTPCSGRYGELYIWDNSNIVESYGGHTLPLTFGFAHYVYHQVYVQFCEILLVPRKVISEMDFFLKDMLGLFDGRVYYNLLNWYKLTSILPGNKYNRGFMETMMGTDKSLENEIAERITPPAYHRSFKALLRRLVTGGKFFWFHLSIQHQVDRFMKRFYLIYNEFRKRDYSRLPSHTIYRDYQELERTLLWHWHAPIINDFLCMIHYGIFKKLTAKWLSHLGDSFHNDLLAGNGNLESALPTKQLILLAKEVEINLELKNLILGTPPQFCLEALNQSPFKDFYQKVQKYIADFGFRCMSEMKLEQKDMHQDPSLFFIFLKNLLNNGQTDLEKYERREREIREKAMALLRLNLSGPKKWIYSWSLKHAKKAVMNRENTRFCRTRIYGVVRSMMNGIGNDFASRNVISHPEDIFYLSLEELKGAMEGTNSIQDLFRVIELRKEQYKQYALNEPPASRFMTRGLVYWNNPRTQAEDPITDDTPLNENQMRGTPCSPGVVEGVVKVIINPQDDLTLKGEILVTERTDPGWIPLYPSASGLLVERGGLLSHSAIVAREMGLPAIVGLKGLTKKLKTGMKIRMDGEKGLIEIL